jgi:hypothetical protein
MARATQPYFSKGLEAMVQPKIDWQAVTVLAKQAALKAVRRQLQREGRVKPSLLPASTLSILAKQYLGAHPELYVQAAQSPIARISQHTHRKRRTDPKGELLCATSVQNLALGEQR